MKSLSDKYYFLRRRDLDGYECTDSKGELELRVLIGDFDIQWKKNDRFQKFKVLREFSFEQYDLAKRTFLAVVVALLSSQISVTFDERLHAQLVRDRRENPDVFDDISF